MNFQYGQDYSETEKSDMSQFNIQKGDIKYLKSENKDVFDFVGFILTENNMLSVFPKHFYNDYELKHLNQLNKSNNEDIKLLFDVFIKYTTDTSSSNKATKYIGEKPEFVSDYPFAPFFEVYKYYRKHGIYYERNIEIKANINGDVSWPKTIQKSQILVSDGNLIFSPLYNKKKRNTNVFLTECMVFVIDHTINSFPYFISLQGTGYKTSSFDFLKHCDYTLQQLKQINNKIFKDSHKKLVFHLILFFEQHKESSKGGNIHIKINYFDVIWERMVSKYLNQHFVSVDESTNSLVFDKTLCLSMVKFKTKEFAVDDSNHQFKIRLDHYANQDDIL